MSNGRITWPSCEGQATEFLRSGGPFVFPLSNVICIIFCWMVCALNLSITLQTELPLRNILIFLNSNN